jgi:hypothetical protein
MTNSPLFWIVAIILIVLATIFIVWLRHNFRVQKVKFNTGMVETELERKKEDEIAAEAPDASINISGNVMAGRNKISVRREKTNVTKNKMVGENEIEVGAKPGPKPQKGKGKK